MATTIDHKKIDAIIRKHIRKLRKPGAMTARPGYKMTGGWVTDKPAVVVTVDKKIDGLPPSHHLPAELDDVPVDVREATGLQRLRQADPAALALVAAHGRNEFKEPDWKYERDVHTGKLVSDAKPKTKATSVKGKKEQIPYKAPANLPLASVTRNMTIVAHASPDDGYPTLTNFLEQTKKRLTVAMYDFTSGDLLNTVKSTIGKNGGLPFQMVLDHPPRNPTANQTDDVTADQLLAADRKAEIDWALTRNDPKAAAWIFPTAYHIKVAVRDGDTFWLSSGNFNVSNQPNLAANDKKRGSLANADRDWHLIVMDEGLARLYETYIQNDFASAKAHQAAGSTTVHNTIHAAMNKHVAEQKKSSQSKLSNPVRKAPAMVKARTFSNVPVTIQPLLTPDSGTLTTLYVDKVLALIKSAKRSLYMQTQYVHPSDKAGDKDFMALVEAFRDAHQRGLDVRLITSQYENTSQWIEKLQAYDLPQVLRIQDRVHNKGIVVDSHVVMVSSENWSADGTLRNRDAGLIVDHADIAQYFEAIFMDDWVHRATQKIVDASYTKSGAKKGKPSKPGAK